MSDPVTNYELEDVLSSIRRLVSEDGYGASEPENTDDIKTEVEDVSIGRKLPEAPNTGKLVLTEAFLVSESETTIEVAEENSITETFVLGDDHAIDSAPQIDVEEKDVLVLNTIFDGLAEAHGPVDDVAESDDNSDEPQDMEVEDNSGSVDDTEHTQTVDVETLDHDAEPKISEIPVDEQIDDTPEDVAGETAADDISEQHDTVQADDDTDVEVVDEETVPEAFQPTADDTIEDAVTIEETVAQSVDEIVAEKIGLAHTVAELEAVISAQNNDWEPDGSEDVGTSPEIEPLEWRSEATRGAQVFEMPRADTAAPTGFQGETELDDVDYGLEDFSEDDAPFLDEAALRDMVSDIVRQELQGPLGERITRNVRKLVRREIHRILATEDFD